jgi:hypothetical protein
MIIFLVGLAALASVGGYAIALVLMALSGDTFAKGCLKFILISWIVLMVLIYLFVYT